MPSATKPTKPPSKIRIAPPIPTQLESSPQELTNLSLDILHQFLSYVDPDAAELLPLTSGSQIAVANKQPEIPISEWDPLYSASTPPIPSPNGGFPSSIVVRSHPDPNRNLFCVQSTIPGVTARQFWSLMASAENRKLWDSTVEDGGVKRWLASTADSSSSSSTDIADALASRIESFRFGSIFMVAKARDMVLLSVDARLPSTAPTSTQEGPLRLVSTSQSIVDPSLPPRKGYTRFMLQTGGFMVEDLGDDGVPESACTAAVIPSSPSGKGGNMSKGLRALARRGRSPSGSKISNADVSTSSSRPKAPRRDARGPAVLVTQVSDLGEMAAWVPASVIRMVASTLVPRSVASVAKVAKSMNVSPVLYRNYTLPRTPSTISSDIEQLGKNAGEWYCHRILPAMVGQGALRKKTQPASSDTALPKLMDSAVNTEPRSPSHGMVPEAALTPDIRPFAANVTNIVPTSPTAIHSDLPKRDTPITHIPLASSPPPRTSSLPGTPVLNRVGAPFPGSPNKPMSPRSPTKASLLGREARGASEQSMSSALGLQLPSESLPLDTPLAMSPAMFQRKALSSSKAIPQERRAAKEPVMNANSRAGPPSPSARDTAIALDSRKAMVTSPVSRSPRLMPTSPISPAEKRSRMLSNEYYAAHLAPPSDVTETANSVSGTSDCVPTPMDHKIQRLSNALVAEMERRQDKASSVPPPSHSPKLPSKAEQGSDLVAMLADALSESLPFVPENQGRVRDQARRVSALLLAGSDALALTLAPGARDSLGLRLDGLSVHSERSARTPQTSDFSTKSCSPVKAGKQKAGSAKYPSNLGNGSNRRSRKPSIDTAARSISVSASQANVSAHTESVISLGAREAGGLKPVSTSSISEPTEVIERTQRPSEPSIAHAHAASASETKAIETLRELNRASQRSTRPVKRTLPKQPANRKTGYGASLLGGLAYYSGYSWYSATASTSETNSSATPQPQPISQASIGRLRTKTANQYSIGRRRSRANYRLENNAKLHPFPASFGRRSGQSVSRRKSVVPLPPPIEGLGVGTMQRLPTQDEPST